MEDPAQDTLEFGAPHGEVLRDKGPRSFCLIVMDGPDKGATFGLSAGVHTIGRTDDCQITLHGRGVSRLHASVYVKAYGDVMVEDHNSTNGVFVDGVRVQGRSPMEAGQILALGPEAKLRLELSAGSVQNLLRDMYESATQDSLTGLLTRRGFEDRLEVEAAVVHRHQMNSCLALIDLDRFKSINDREGHEAGDVVLQSVAAQLKETVRAGDLACRWGGEEFTVYIRQTPMIGAMTLLERLRQRMADTDILLPKGNTTRITFSAGVVDLLDFPDWRAAFRKADEKLYQAKAEGRNRVIFYSPDEG